MMYLTTILFCLGISRSGLAQCFFTCGCPQTSIQLVAVPNCCRNNGNGAYQFGSLYMVPGPVEGCGSFSPVSKVGVCGCESSCAQPICCTFSRQFSGCPISVARYSSCQNNQGGSDGLCIQPISPCCSGYSFQPMSSCCSTPMYQPISSCCSGTNIPPICPCPGPAVQPLYQMTSCSFQQNRARGGGQGKEQGCEQRREERIYDSGEHQEKNNTPFCKLGCCYNGCCNTRPGNTGCCNRPSSYAYSPYHCSCLCGYQIPTCHNAHHSPPGGPRYKQMQQPPMADKISPEDSSTSKISNKC